MKINIEEALFTSRRGALVGNDSAKNVWSWAIVHAFKEFADAPRALYPSLVDIGMIDAEGLEFHEDDGVA